MQVAACVMEATMHGAGGMDLIDPLFQLAMATVARQRGYILNPDCLVSVDRSPGGVCLIPYTLHPTPYTLHPAPYTLHPTPYTLHPTPYTLHTIPETLISKVFAGLRIQFIIVMIRWTGLAPWEFEFPFPGSLTSTFLQHDAGGDGRGLRVPLAPKPQSLTPETYTQDKNLKPFPQTKT